MHPQPGNESGLGCLGWNARSNHRCHAGSPIHANTPLTTGLAQVMCFPSGHAGSNSLGLIGSPLIVQRTAPTTQA